MLHSLAHALTVVDAWILAGLVPIACYIALSGLDDLFIDLVWFLAWLRGRLPHRINHPSPVESAPDKRIAIFVPLWHEHQVIGSMLAHNIAAIRYSEYAFFVGAYPNDHATLAAVREVEARYQNVHLAVCPHDGPTSKADCLNWIYQCMLLREETASEHYDLILTHDAEDLIHPDSLRTMNRLSPDYDFIQIPVLALRTPAFAFTHGVYCDEFAEFQTRDLPVRNLLGGFIPSAGVGTAYSRRALEALAETESNRIFEPTCLTEDYENGHRLHNLGMRQLFLPPGRTDGSWLATREFFPQNLNSAIRQRTRWVTGISLQGWERHGWRGGWKQIYWLWRDRKGLIGAPVSLLTNAMALYGLATRLWDRVSPPASIVVLCTFTLALQGLQLAVRMGCVARIYGWRFSILVPLRSIHANAINATATLRALYSYARARLRHEPLLWLKTAHAYPSREALIVRRRKIGEILVGSGYVSEKDLARALASQPQAVRIGQHLIALGLLHEDDLYEALSIQQAMPLGAQGQVSRRAARALPAHVVREWRVLPFRVTSGRLLIASPDVPTEALQSELSHYTSLELRFHLVTPRQFQEMQQAVR